MAIVAISFRNAEVMGETIRIQDIQNAEGAENAEVTTRPNGLFSATPTPLREILACFAASDRCGRTVPCDWSSDFGERSRQAAEDDSAFVVAECREFAVGADRD